MELKTDTTRSYLPTSSLLQGQGVVNTIFIYNDNTSTLQYNFNHKVVKSPSYIYQTLYHFQTLKSVNKLAVVVSLDSNKQPKTKKRTTQKTQHNKTQRQNTNKKKQQKKKHK